MTIDERMTICNMSVEGGARVGYVNPDETTFAYLKGRRFVPSGAAFDRTGARRRFDEMTAGRVPWDDRHLAPIGQRLIVVRMLTNLRASYQRRRDPVNLAMVARMRASMVELQAEAGDAVPEPATATAGPAGSQSKRDRRRQRRSTRPHGRAR